MKKLILTLILLLGACAGEPPTEDDLVGEIGDDSDAGVGVHTEALSAAMTWPALSVRGYDTMNALKCFVDGYGGNNATCQYGVDYYQRQCTNGWACARCKSNGWGGLIYSTRLNPYTGNGWIWAGNTAIVSNVALGPILAGDVRTFTYDSGEYCRVFKSWGGTYAEFGP